MPDKIIISRKLAEVITEIKHLNSLVKLSQKQLLSDVPMLYFSERVIERLITAAVDINYHILTDITGMVPDDYYSSFIELGTNKILSVPVANRIAPSAGLRNLIIHEYMKIDYKKYYTSLKIANKDFQIYAKAIQKYMDSL